MRRPAGSERAGYRLKVKVTGRLNGYTTTSRTSKVTGKVAKARFTAAPRPTIAVEGTPRVGKTLTAQTGTWQHPRGQTLNASDGP